MAQEAVRLAESVLDVAGATRLAVQAPTITLPAEDVSYQVVERFFSRCAVRYDTVFLRWDKSRATRCSGS